MEQANQTLLALLCFGLVKHTNSTWVEFFFLVDLVINTSVAHASGKSPFEDIYRYHVRPPVNLVLGQERDKLIV